MESRFADQYVKLGKNIKKYRKRLGLSQEQLANRMSISRSYLSKIEAPNCQKSFSIETLFLLAETLHIPVYKLLEFDNQEI
ncbi:helix-turn-helix domain-containing protein [Maledivibacter halophilus]|uniref:Predicted transcriptional regulator with C-terminal CBS domains n=1 Tax=Maledivibacter halophilus TaxID=36842 RepID=A0A1T5K684_9FIRM|nr:helix-turn-helix transcriptional regulator [Maledivibacter halophilus]SKC59252.1 Predicted transcriptional regulator with C-terminal CBS domains [Maledivibacter halophilus]